MGASGSAGHIWGGAEGFVHISAGSALPRASPLLPPTSQSCSANVLVVIKGLFIPRFLAFWEGFAVYLTGILCL